MKKLIYVLMSTLLFVGCTTFEEYVPENYGDGPTIAVSATEATDSTFTLTLTPGSGTVYYSYVVQQTEEPIEVIAANLLKGNAYKGVVNAVLNTAKNPTFISNMRTAAGLPLLLPNTTYQIYAVAANKEGIVGQVATATIKTTDAKKPGPTTFAGTAATKSAAITFSEKIVRSSAKVTATYYKEFDVANPVIVELPNENIVINGNVVTVSTPDAPAGAFVNINWEAGAFTDVFGNTCNAYTSKGFSPTTGAQVGVRYRVATSAFEVKDSYFVSPVVGSTFLDWAKFEGVVTFDQNIYRVVKNVKTGDLTAIYSTATKTSTVQLAAANWSVAGASVKFALPEAPAFGDGVNLNIKAGVVFDVWGNPNAAYAKTTVKWTLFKFTKSLVIGNFNFSGVSTYDDINYDNGDFSSVEDPMIPNTVIIKDFVLPGAEISATYNLDTRKFYMTPFDSLGVTTLNGVSYEMYLYNYVNSAAETIEFDLNADGTIVGNELALVVYNPLTDKLSFYDKFKPAVFTPKAAAKVKVVAKVKKSKQAYAARLIPVTDKRVISAFHKMK